MKTGIARLSEIYLDGSARLDCPPNLIPAPGQYLLAHAEGSDSPLPDPVFFYDSAPMGFRAAPPLPSYWAPGTTLNIRGPLGKGFTLPASARKIALIAFDNSPARLRGLIEPALKQGGEILLICDSNQHNFPEVIEIQPVKALEDACKWADYVAIDAVRESLSELKKRFGALNQIAAANDAQVLVRAPMPCGGIAECGACALSNRPPWKAVCKDGPVFNWIEMIGLI